jgi:hypothetical protein
MEFVSPMVPALGVQMTTWATDSQGRLTLPSVHDGHVTEVCYKKSSLSITVLRDTQRVIFSLEGLQELNISVWLKPIVSEILIIPLKDAGDLSDGTIQELWDILYGERIYKHDLNKIVLRNIQQTPHSYLFGLICSYGGTLMCVARDLAVSTQADV